MPTYPHNFKPSEVILVYVDGNGNEHKQLVSNLLDMGTLIDPETGDDMEVAFVQTTGTRGGW